MFCDLGRTIRDGCTRTATRIGSDLKLAKGVLGFTKDERGNMTMVFGFSILCSVAFVGMTVDMGRAYNTKGTLEKALDQASLAAARKFDATGDKVTAAKLATTYFFQTLPKGINARLDSVKVDDRGGVSMTASSDMRTTFLGVVGIPNIHIDRKVVSLAQDVNNVDAQKVEIALVMDVTGSMGSNSKLTTAKTAAKRLVDVLIPTQATAGAVRVSVVPFSEYVNAGSFASAATGVAPSTTSSYACTVQQNVCVTVSNTVSSSSNNDDDDDDDNSGNGNNNGNNGWGNGGDDGHNGPGYGGSTDWDSRSSSNSNGNNSNNGNGNGNGNNGNGNGNGGSNGGNCTSGSQGGGYNAHGWDSDGYDRNGYNASGRNQAGQSGGSGTHQVCSMQSVQSTCQRTTYVNTCMAERMASSGHAYDDASPSTALFHAFTTTSASNANCTAPTKPVIPLTTSRTDLYTAIDGLTAAGYTAGHIGAAWGWYTISDKWATFWPTGSKPAATDAAKVKKVVLLMTDGAYNTHYDANYASVFEGSSNNATAANGRSAAQAAAICTNMKAAGVEVFTIGLELGSDTASKTALQNCASPWNAQIAQHFYDVSMATSNQNGLIATFTDIANRIAASTGTGNKRTRITDAGLN
jgi:Flp pilus assembly protein TadG